MVPILESLGCNSLNPIMMMLLIVQSYFLLYLEKVKKERKKKVTAKVDSKIPPINFFLQGLLKLAI